LSELDLAYLQVNRAVTEDVAAGAGDPISIEWVREYYPGTLIAAESFTLEEGASAVTNGTLDAVAFGRLFIANPDLPARFAQGAPLNLLRRETIYTNGESGYVDYPMLANGASNK
jgi:N-ethylmaleimide reductase